ncbi:hypothetical protein KSP39_PZI021803 [Platanthera zijinensis]|uniref:Uncharacterized protein n=1 Tax=Platanthera zijinensis TaxID=2320716 RepID=A0AAP0FVR3_9ASPA
MLQSPALYPWILKPASLTLSPVSLRLSIHCCSSSPSILSESLDAAVAGDLSAKERRQLRNGRREKNAAVSGNWREEVEERLARRRKKDYSNWKEKLNLDNLAKLGPQWWTVRVSRVNGQETVERLSRALARGFPDMDFKVSFLLLLPFICGDSMLWI